MTDTSIIPLRRCGDSGLHLSTIGVGLGRWGQPASGVARVDDAQGFAILDRARALGATHWDTASGYQDGNSERLVGRYFAARGRSVREEVVLATKWMGPRGAGRGELRKAVDACLQRLQTDYIDLFFLHHPGMDEHGRYIAPIDETWGALDDLVSQGKIHYLGLSSAHAANLRDAVAALARVGKDPARRLAVVQNCYNLLQRGQVGRGIWYDWKRGASEASFLADLDQFGVGLIPFWPLADGALSGRYRAADLAAALARKDRGAQFAAQYLEGPTFAAIEAIGRFADGKGLTMSQVAVAWLLAKSQVASVICGVTDVRQLEDNAGAACVALSAADVAALDAIATTAESVDDFCRRYFK